MKTINIIRIVLVLLLIGLLSLSVMAFTGTLFKAKEISSPSDWIKEEQIKVYRDKVVLDIPNAAWLTFTDTNSMDPFLDQGANAIEIKPSSPNVIEVGDMISYNSIFGVILHRVVEKGEDDKGIYFFVRGDNNPFRDPIKVRFGDIEGVVVAVIY